MIILILNFTEFSSAFLAPSFAMMAEEDPMNENNKTILYNQQVLLQELKSSLFSSSSITLDINPIPFEKESAAHTKALFRLIVTDKEKNEKQHYIIKVINDIASSDNEEVKKLEKLKKSSLSFEFTKNTSCCITQMIYSGTCDLQKKSGLQKKYNFVLLEEAQGKSLSKIDEEFFQNQNETALFKNIGKVLGCAIGTLHTKFILSEDDHFAEMKSYAIHGDLHANNIFYDEEEQRIFLIDNSGFCDSLNESKYIKEDLEIIFLQTINLPRLLLKENHQFKEQVTIFLKEFIQAYSKEFQNQNCTKQEILAYTKELLFRIYNDLTRNEYSTPNQFITKEELEIEIKSLIENMD